MATIATLEVELNAQAAIQGMKQLERATDSMADKTTADLRRVEKEAKSVSGRIGSTLKAMAAGFAGGLAAGAIPALFNQALAGIQNFVRGGLESAKNFETAQRSIAASISATFGKTLPQAFGEAKSVLAELDRVAAKSPATFEQLVGGFSAVTAALSAQGIPLKQQIALVDQMTQAMGAMGIPAEQMRQEILSIAQANISADSALAHALNIRNEDIKVAKEQGKLYEFITQKLGPYAQLSETTAKTMSGALSNLEDALGRLARQSMQPIMEPLVGALNEVTKALGNPALKESMSVFIAWMAEMVRQGAILVAWLSETESWFYKFSKSARTAVAQLTDQEAALLGMAKSRQEQLAGFAKMQGNMELYNKHMAEAERLGKLLTERNNELAASILGISAAARGAAQDIADLYASGGAYAAGGGISPAARKVAEEQAARFGPSTIGPTGRPIIEGRTMGPPRAELIRARTTYYGYEKRGQRDWDPYSARGIGVQERSLTAGYSVALSPDIERQLGAKPGDLLTIIYPDGTRRDVKFEDRTATRISGAVDIYTPTGPEAFEGQVQVMRRGAEGTETMTQTASGYVLAAQEASAATQEWNARLLELGTNITESLTGNITDAFTAMITGSKSAADAFSDMAKSILADISQMLIKLAVQLAMQAMLGGISSMGGGIGQFAARILGGIGGAPRALPAQFGGLVQGPSGIDRIPARLTAGEFVMNRSATARLGPGRLGAMNRGLAMAAKSEIHLGGSHVVINQSAGNGGDSLEDKKLQAQSMQKVIDKAIIEAVAREQRTGGILSRTRAHA